MAVRNLTARIVESAKPPRGRWKSGKPKDRRELWDAKVNGLGLRITRDGRKSWTLMYRNGRRLRRMKLGDYPALSLADARDKAQDALHEVNLDRDPAAAKHERRDADTFGELAACYLDEYALGAGVPRGKKGELKGKLLDVDGHEADVWTYRVIAGRPSKRSWAEDRRKLKVEVLPAWKSMQVREITRRDVRELTEAIARRGAPVQANRTRAMLHKLFAWAVEHDVIDFNPATGTPRPGGSEKKRQRDRVLTADELRAFWAATRPASAEQMTLAMSAFWRLRLVTAQRAGEVVAMRWDDLDLEESWWTIPAAISKNNRSHRVPLSPMALEILGNLHRYDDRVLAGALGNRQRSKTTTLIPVDDFKGHDLRRTAASTMASAGIPRLHIAMVLNHAERGVTAVYDRHSYDPEKRVALDTWAAKLQAILKRQNGTDVVVPFVRG